MVSQIQGNGTVFWRRSQTKTSQFSNFPVPNAYKKLFFVFSRFQRTFPIFFMNCNQLFRNWNIESLKNVFLLFLHLNFAGVLVQPFVHCRQNCVILHRLCNMKARFDEELFIILIPDFFCRKVRVSKSSKRVCFAVTLKNL